VDDDAVGERLLSLSLLCAICMYNPIICQDWLGTNIKSWRKQGAVFCRIASRWRR
jgi:hypothetical protein